MKATRLQNDHIHIYSFSESPVHKRGSMGCGFAFSFVLLLAVITAIAAPSCRASVTIRGVDPALFGRYSDVDGKFKCLDGTKTIPYSHLNDGYCDCIDGSDEPGTAACANGNFYCKNAGSEPVLLNATFVDDGVCGKDGENGDPDGLLTNLTN
jgi:protein kinase C substrate 80K-H